MPSDRTRSARAPLPEWLLPAGAWIAGIVTFFQEMLVSGFERIVGDFADSRLCNYLLEHTFLWLTGRPGHERLWDLPIFHPVERLFAYSESFLSVAPLYWGWRLAGLPSDSAFQALLLTAASLNFFTAHLLLRRGFGFGPPAAALGAFVCAYGNMRAAQLHHPQLLLQFYSFLALFCLVRWMRGSAERSAGWVAGFCACVVLQVYASFYLGWFLILVLGIACAWALLLPSCRPRLLAALRPRIPVLAVSLAAAGLLLLPLALAGLAVTRETGWRTYEEVAILIPRAQAWLYMGRYSLLYHWMRDFPLFQALRIEQEQRLGLGFVTLACAGLGLWRARKHPWAALLALCSLTIVALATDFAGASLWRGVYALVPGAGAIRAVSRIGLLLLIPAGVGIASFSEGLRRRGALAWLLLGLIAAEQVYVAPAYSKAIARTASRHVVRQVEAHCRSYYWSVVVRPEDDGSWVLYQMDAVMAQPDLGIPTVNGYSGDQPAGYGSLAHNVIRTDEDRLRLRRDLEAWRVRHGLGPEDVCLVEAAAPY